MEDTSRPATESWSSPTGTTATRSGPRRIVLEDARMAGRRLEHVGPPAPPNPYLIALLDHRGAFYSRPHGQAT